MNEKRKLKSHLRCGEKSKRAGRIILSVLFFSFLLLMGCDGTPNPPDDDTLIPVTNITGVPSGKQTDVDLTLTGTVIPSDATNKTIVWSIAADDDGSTNPELTGNLLKTASEGTVKVTATIANGLADSTPYTQTFTINVLNEVPAFVAVTNITGVPSAATAGVDLSLTGTVVPSTATNKTIVWSIAAVNTLAGATVVDGVFKAATNGTATVTATIVNGLTETANYTQNFTINVTDEPPLFVAVTNITGVPSAATAGVDLPLTGTVVPDTATNQTINWSIAAVNTLAGATVVDGVFKAATNGTATVTATIVNGLTETANYTQNFTINVTDEPPFFVAVTNITDVPTEATAGVDLPLTGVVIPDTATNQTISWSIAATNTLAGATVVDGVFKATTNGTAMVTATIVNGLTASTDYTKTFEITVSAAPGSVNITITIGSDAFIDDPDSLIVEGVLTLSRSDEAVTLELANSEQYDEGSIKWRVQNTAITGSGAEFELDASNPVYLTGREYFVTVEALKGGVPYDYTITFKVEEE